MNIENLEQEIGALIEKFELTKECLNLKELSLRLGDLLKERESLSFWSNVDFAMNTNKEIKSLQTLFDKVNNLQNRLASLTELKQMLEQSQDLSSLNEIYCEVINLSEEVDNLSIRTLMDGKYDICNAIITIHSGAGGTESQDWVSMLYRMYNMYCTDNNIDITVIDSVDGGGVGLKSITILAKGEYAYGKLKGEMGVHRLVRISPFDASKRRHTTFASVEVAPEIINENEIILNNDDLKIDTYRSSGAGGQHVNTTDSAVRITHIPSGIVVTCQNERSQLQNRENALKILKSKLLSLKLEQEQQKMKEIKGELKKIEWGSQIRSYVFQPYTMVKDHRTDYETSDVQDVVDGNLQPLINEYLKKSHTNNQ
ncbi:MAG: peptide chain release factor 2 [Clostridia bacterium]|nr:peptide chain release factor 2 [Clostridia bacterium]